ncbi:MAG: thioredoxin domain-containing protein [Pseudomonadota bacterium]|nr:thioredoxin domain-containing protein [Pseudomonadota bacterium]MDE3038467.1 thioredoxin domain-containing protein [Pseudomonadota bacterium]
MPSRRLLLATVSMAFWSFAAAAQAPAAQAPAAAANAPVTRAELPGLVKEILMNDPGMIMQAVQKLRDKQGEETGKQAQAALEKHKSELFDDAASPSVGNAKTADVTMIEFFDYHCGYCKQVFPAIAKLAGEDKKLRIVFREFPILSEDSVMAARAALAVNHIAPGKYFQFYSALMKSNGEKFDEKMLMDTARKLGINTAKLKTAMKDKSIDAELDKNRALAEALGIRGTPGIIIGDHLFPGAIPYDDLRKIIHDIRTGKDKQAAPSPVAPAVPRAQTND